MLARHFFIITPNLRRQRCSVRQRFQSIIGYMFFFYVWVPICRKYRETRFFFVCVQALLYAEFIGVLLCIYLFIQTVCLICVAGCTVDAVLAGSPAPHVERGYGTGTYYVRRSTYTRTEPRRNRRLLCCPGFALCA